MCLSGKPSLAGTVVHKEKILRSAHCSSRVVLPPWQTAARRTEAAGLDEVNGLKHIGIWRHNCWVLLRTIQLSRYNGFSRCKESFTVYWQTAEEYRWGEVLPACAASNSDVAIGCPKYGSGYRDDCSPGPHPRKRSSPVANGSSGRGVKSVFARQTLRLNRKKVGDPFAEFWRPQAR